MAISTADFKNGMCIVNNGKMCTIVEFQHVKPGKGGAFVRTKLRDIKTGRVVDYTFNAGTKFDTVRLETRKMQYLYNDGSDFYFMDPNTFDQMSMPAETVGDTAKWLKENDEASLLYAGEELISIEPQMFVELGARTPSPASRATPPPTPPSRQPSRPASSCRYLLRSSRSATCWSTPATAASSRSASDRIASAIDDRGFPLEWLLLRD